MTLADIHAKARAFDAKVQRRNAIEYVACGVVIVAFVPTLLNPQSWMMQVRGGPHHARDPFRRLAAAPARLH